MSWELVRTVLLRPVMKNLVIGSILLTCSIASAEPRVAALDLSSTETEASLPAPSPARADRYVSVGGSFGANTAVDWLYGGASVDGGYRLTDTLWIRGRFNESARIGDGAINQGPMLVAPQYPTTEVLSGLEWRGCANRAVCVVGGFDVGYRFGQLRYGHDGVTTAPRIGLDVGTEHLRFRPMVEANVSAPRNYDTEIQGFWPAFGIGLTTAVAYQW
jgi:hypothetical protein